MNKCPSLVGVDHKKVVLLLSFGDWKVPAVGDGVVDLSRRVVSAGVHKLKVSVRAWQDGNNVVEADHVASGAGCS